jgi:hypothetical protein
MARGPLTFRQRDLTAAVKAVAAAGYEIARVRVSRAGDIIVEIGKPREPAGDKNEWDDPA